MRWRFLPQVLAHALQLPPRACLAIPWLGVGVLLVGCGSVLRRAAEISGAQVLGGLILVATTSPVLCATGWLGINDAWYVAGLVLIAFSDGALPLAAAVLIGPWIDERFWFGLPGALAVRWLRTGQALPRSEKIALVLACIPYAAVRVAGIALMPVDPSVDFLRSGAGTAWQGLVWAPVGWWMGLRFGLVPVLAAARSARPRLGGKGAAAAVCALILPVGALAPLAFDTTRSVGIVLPWLLFGYLELLQQPGSRTWLKYLLILQLLGARCPGDGLED